MGVTLLLGMLLLVAPGFSQETPVRISLNEYSTSIVKQAIEDGRATPDHGRSSDYIDALVPLDLFQTWSEDERMSISIRSVDEDGVSSDGYAQHLAYLRRRVQADADEERGYLTNEEVSAELDKIVEAYPHLARKYSIGESVEGVPLEVIEISDNGHRGEGEPQLRYIANMHGDEVVGRELMVALAWYLCDNYLLDDEVGHLVNTTSIHLLPTMNPDGFTKGMRENANGVDLNRNFPDRVLGGSVYDVEPETRAVMDWHEDNNFMLCANFHGGALVASYPFDGNRQNKDIYTPSQDDDIFRSVSLAYSENHPVMPYSSTFDEGITNGAHWYAIYGGMQDWSYTYDGAMEVTLEVSYLKWPTADDIPTYINQNMGSMIAYLLEASNRVEGKITNSSGNIVPGAVVSILDRDEYHSFEVDPYSWYFRILPPGNHTLVVTADDYETLQKQITIPEDGGAVRVDIILEAVAGTAAGEEDDDANQEDAPSGSTTEMKVTATGTRTVTLNGDTRNASPLGRLAAIALVLCLQVTVLLV